MPVVGVVCEYDDTLQDFKTCIDCHQARGKGRNCDFPTFALKLMRDNGDRRRGAGWSATTILNCPRAVALLENFDYYEELESGWNKIRGELLHMAAESDPDPPEGLIREKRLRKYTLVNGEAIPVTGKADEIDTWTNKIIDYKFTAEIPEKDKEEHEAQFNIYAWLCNGGFYLNEDGTEGEQVFFDIVGGGMHYLTMKRKKKRDGTIIRPWKKKRYPVWASGMTERLIQKRLVPLIDYRDTGILPKCDPYVTGYWACECTKIEAQLQERGIEYGG